jgi:hypothetical protein
MVLTFPYNFVADKLSNDKPDDNTEKLSAVLADFERKYLRD